MESSKLRTVLLLLLLNLHLLVDRLGVLENRLEEMARMLDMVKAQVIIRAKNSFTFSKVLNLTQFSFLGLYQNQDLQTRVNYLEGCECVRRRCVWEGHEVEEGRRWQADPNTVCLCSSGKVTCQTSKRDGGNLNLFIALFIISSQGCTLKFLL
uniref:Uncharacterized protein n=1 Tax=Poecilia latipinna TaxID=48699 RepID=A0A3B3VKB1_9TELE